MRVVVILAFSLLLCASSTNAQNVRIGVGYNYLYSKQFDNLIQTYNFSRPYLQENQPLLSSGIHSDFSYLFNSDRSLKSGFILQHSAYRSWAENLGTDTKLVFNLMGIGYLMHYENKQKLSGLFFDLSASGLIGILIKKIDNETLLVDEEKLRSIQFGGYLNLSTGYKFNMSDKLVISPFIGFGFAPYFSEGTSESVINQTSTLISEDEEYTSFMNFQVGIRIHL